MFSLILLILTINKVQGLSNPYKFLQTSLISHAVTKNLKQNCVCVPYWQCKEDFSGVAEDGIDIIDIRVMRDASNNNENKMECSGDYDVCCKIECGKPNNGFNLMDPEASMMKYRISDGGNKAEFAEFPWMLGLLVNLVYKCGASLIHPQVAITAAHCVSKEHEYTLRAGEWNWENDDEPLPPQDRKAKKIITHPHYHAGSLRNDIAILILDEPFTLTENVGIVCLPPSGKIYDRKRCTATGWGRNSYTKGKYQTVLKKVNLPMVPKSQCLNSLRRARLGPYFKLDKSFVCAGGEYNKDTCKGDGGSPLVCPVGSQPERYEQVGIVSWGLTCGMQNTPGVYANVALFRSWIDQELLKNNFDIFMYNV